MRHYLVYLTLDIVVFGKALSCLHLIINSLKGFITKLLLCLKLGVNKFQSSVGGVFDGFHLLVAYNLFLYAVCTGADVGNRILKLFEYIYLSLDSLSFFARNSSKLLFKL